MATSDVLDLRKIEQIGTTAHALESLRERLPAGSAHCSLSDKELRSSMERAWKYARESGSVELWWERVESRAVCNYLVDLSTVLEAPLVGLVREDDRSPGRPCYITVVTSAMAERSQSTNRWARDPDILMGAPPLKSSAFAALSTVKPATFDLVVTWGAVGKMRYQAIQSRDVTAFVETLLADGVDEGGIKFWIQSPGTIRTTRTVELKEMK